jgi:2'-5' RNA ligase
VRLFVAINLPEWVSDRIFAGTDRLRALRGIRWGGPAAVHLTLKFLGDVDDDRAREIAAMLGMVAAEHEPFDLRLTSVGGFPSLQRPRVVWLGIEARQELLELQQGLEDALAALGFERETRRYHPHVTLGRVRRGRTIDATELLKLARQTDVAGSWRVRHVDLMRSRLKPTGAEYETVASERLTETGTGE